MKGKGKEKEVNLLNALILMNLFYILFFSDKKNELILYIAILNFLD